LTPLQLTGHAAGTREDARVLSVALAEEIRLLVPARLQLEEDWRLVFSLERDGVSLKTLYQKCAAVPARRGGFVLVIRDAGGGVRPPSNSRSTADETRSLARTSRTRRTHRRTTTARASASSGARRCCRRSPTCRSCRRRRARTRRTRSA
jgi:hypothetical protein